MIISADYQVFITKFKAKSGLDLNLYKEGQMKRRLRSFIEKRGFEDFNHFYRAMETDDELYKDFLDRITINVSEFYRNSSRWRVLEDIILPPLIEKNKPLKVWSAACSTGEEAYTLAMILSNYIPSDRISILATDIDENVLSRARLGVYAESSLNEVPNVKRLKHFTKEGSLYKVNDATKNLVTFKNQNLLADGFDDEFDLIVCRNVMIYFTEEAKFKLYEKFSNALRTGGIFFVGSTEQIFTPQKYGLESVETFFYRKFDIPKG